MEAEALYTKNKFACFMSVYWMYVGPKSMSWSCPPSFITRLSDPLRGAETLQGVSKHFPRWSNKIKRYTSKIQKLCRTYHNFDKFMKGTQTISWQHHHFKLFLSHPVFKINFTSRTNLHTLHYITLHYTAKLLTKLYNVFFSNREGTQR